MNTMNVNTSEMSGSLSSANPRSLSLPMMPVAATSAVLAAALAAVLYTMFPVFVLPDELLASFPPPEIAEKREATYALYRLLNPMLGLAVFALVTSVVLPMVLKTTGHASKENGKLLVPFAILAAVLACIGPALGHLVLELQAASSLGLGRTFLARWLEFAFLGAGVGAAVGASVGGTNLAMRLAVNSAIVGVLAALVLDLIYVPIATSKVDLLVPGGIVMQSPKDPLSLTLFMVAIVATITLGCTKELSKPK